MGLFDFLMPSTEKKVAKAQKLIDEGRFAEARLALMGIDDPAAKAAFETAETGLVKLNLDGALAWAKAGDETQVVAHLERAQKFHHGGKEALFEQTEVALERIRRRRDHTKLWSSLEDSAARRSKLGIDPTDPAWVAKNNGAIQLADAEKDPNGLPMLVIYPEPAIDEPGAIERPKGNVDATAIAAATEALKGMYPTEQGAGITALHGEAVLHTLDGHPEKAIELLMPGRADDPVAHFELGRAACALANYDAADLCFGLYAELTGGHRTVGEVHSGEAQTQVVAHLGDYDRALELIDEIRAKTPHQAPFLFAALAIRGERLADAEPVLAMLKRTKSRDPRTATLLTALAIRRAVSDLAEAHPILKGVVPPGQEEEMKQRSALADALSAKIAEAIDGLD